MEANKRRSSIPSLLSTGFGVSTAAHALAITSFGGWIKEDSIVILRIPTLIDYLPKSVTARNPIRVTFWKMMKLCTEIAH